MRKKLVRILAWFVAVQAVAFVVGQFISRRLTFGDESSDVFTTAAVFFGKQFRSRARSLKSGSAVAAIGGIELDLRDAILDPGGAELELKTTMGGIQVYVPEEWAIDVDAENHAGDVAVNVTPLEDLPEDAPKLHIHATTTMGGVAVTT
jgi:predicted membrane protein